MCVSTLTPGAVVLPAGASRRGSSSFADAAAAPGHGASARHAPPGHALPPPNAPVHAGSSSAAEQQASFNDFADMTMGPDLAQPAASRAPAEVTSQDNIPSSPVPGSQVKHLPATTQPGIQLGRHHADDGYSVAESQGALDSVRQGSQGPAASISKGGHYPQGPSAAQAPRMSIAPVSATYQPDRMALLARLALEQLNIDEAAAPETALPKESVTIVRRADGFVTSERQHDLDAEFELLSLDPKGILKPIDVPMKPDAKDLQILPGWSHGKS